MKKLTIISFDIIRPEEPQISLSVGSIIAALKKHEAYEIEFFMEHFGYNLFEEPNKCVNWSQEKINWESTDFFAISCYIWAHKQATSVMEFIRFVNPKAKIIAGGYQISTQDDAFLNSIYPNADYFIHGYAESALPEILMGKIENRFCKSNPDWNSLPSPFLTESIPLNHQTKVIRMESKRGCPYSCNFCSQHDIRKPKANYYQQARMEEELSYIFKFSPKRINLTDPVFNMGNTYIPFLKEIYKYSSHSTFNFQVRPELISKQNDLDFLKWISMTNSEIELGIQTFDPEVNKLIKRGNQYLQIERTFEMLKEWGIKFGVSLIYGLPGQTLSSFQKDVEVMKKNGVSQLVAYPLMLLPGTELFQLKDCFQLKEQPLGDFQIPHVVSSKTFTERDWSKMHELAIQLNPAGRLF